MSDSSLKLSDRFDIQVIIRLGILVLLSIVALGSLTEKASLSGTFQKGGFIVYVPLFVVSYLIIIFGFVYSGLNPNRFELFFLPLVIIFTIVFGISVTSFLEFGDNDPNQGETSSVQSDILSRPTMSDMTQQTTGSLIETAPSGILEETTPKFFEFLSLLVTIVLIIAVLSFVAYTLLMKTNRKPIIDIVKHIDYSKSDFQTNKSIIEYYIDSSNHIDRLKGSAPDWFSPTNYANHVSLSPGPPLSSYLDRLTILYENARFSEMEMSNDDVIEAKELNFEISNKVEEMAELINKEGLR